YGDMYPITVIGRILACICAYFGVATSGILVSILVDRYQRVYSRKKIFPEQIISAADPTEREHEEKQDFINRKLTESNRLLSNKQIVPQTSAPSITSPTCYRNFSKCKSIASRVRFFISYTENQTDDQSMSRTPDDSLNELKQAVENSGEQVDFKLIRSNTVPLNSKITTSDEPFLNSKD
ncbi:unnamed protein product, partial [Rotaria sp. Silwood2]